MKFRGLTLVELVVVIAMLGILLVLSFNYINPSLQLNKVNDAKRKEDLQQIKNALDTYYNDHSCYPTAIPFGSSWSENEVVYMRKVPQDPDCATNPTKCYIYKYSGTCPQWNVLFAKLTKAPVTGSCQLISPSCTPSDYASNSWSCAVSGDTDCAHLTSSALSSGSDSVPGGSQGSGAGVTDTPTPIPNSLLNHACSGNPPQCNVVPAGTGQYYPSEYYNGRACNGDC